MFYFWKRETSILRYSIRVIFRYKTICLSQINLSVWGAAATKNDVSSSKSISFFFTRVTNSSINHLNRLKNFDILFSIKALYNMGISYWFHCLLIDWLINIGRSLHQIYTFHFFNPSRFAIWTFYFIQLREYIHWNYKISWNLKRRAT